MLYCPIIYSRIIYPKYNYIICKFLPLWIRDSEKIDAYYRKKILKYSIDSIASLDWKTKKHHRQFILHAFKHIKMKLVQSVLDVGCGDCRILKYLSSKSNNTLTYEGIDIVDKFVKKAKKEYSDKHILIRRMNFLNPEYSPKSKFDLVVNLGGLNSKVRYRYQHLRYFIEKMISCSRRYVVFNVITDISHGFFVKSHIRKVGSITGYEISKVMKILKKLQMTYNIKYNIHDTSIFPGSRDTFILIEIL